MSNNIFCSSIIATIGRPSLAQAATSILDQSFPGKHEVIVVNDSKDPLVAEHWHADPRVKIFDFHSGSCIATRNRGAEAAKGQYLHFMDDDDWLLPNAFQQFWESATAHPEALLLYGAAHLVDEHGLQLGQVNLNKSGNCFAELLAGSWIQVGQSLTKTESFLEVGGFDETFSITEETHLQRQLALNGDFAHTPAPVINVLRGQGWQTSVDYGEAVAMNRRSRAWCLDQPRAFARLQDSAGSSYWHGRILHAYLADAKWLVQKNNVLEAMNRLRAGLVSVVRAGKYALERPYWQALQDDHVPTSQARLLG